MKLSKKMRDKIESVKEQTSAALSETSLPYSQRESVTDRILTCEFVRGTATTGTKQALAVITQYIRGFQVVAEVLTQGIAEIEALEKEEKEQNENN